ncbi:chloramphenicol phosphotransferase CPT family protein [Amycolatopsis sp. NPDC001319]|uniref:chloramphenicol phosphotransferase CPT family protein n=1 Tax=unclassified Amycolatopsis TaxID=2618356 RepID=UPI0036BBD94B
MEPVARGRVILLNGPSSSGKSSIGQALLAILPEPWFHVPVDGINAMRSTRYTRELDEAGVQEMLRRTRRGYHRAVAALTSTGNDVVMDYLLSEPWRLDDLLVVLDGYDVTLVDVHCAPEELARRERSRGDRPHGLAASQTLIYSHGDHDFVVDTTHRTAADCAREIADRRDAVGRPKAFERLRAARARPS